MKNWLNGAASRSAWQACERHGKRALGALRFGVCFGAMLVLTAGCEDAKKEPPPAATPPVPKPAAAPAPVPIAPTPAPVPAAPVVAEKKPVTCPKPPKVAFTDPVLEAEVRRKAGKADGEISIADLRKIKSVDLTRGKGPVDLLDPCIFPLLSGLHHLYLGRGGVSDLSPIATLTQIEGLRVASNPISVLTPLAGMAQMDQLDLGHTQVRDLTPLERMTKLTELMLDDTPVDDVSPLAGLTKLERLSLKRTRVTDVSALKGLTKLKFLYVGGSAITSVTSLQRPGLKISSED